VELKLVTAKTAIAQRFGNGRGWCSMSDVFPVETNEKPNLTLEDLRLEDDNGSSNL